jgi:hypothetical protein
MNVDIDIHYFTALIALCVIIPVVAIMRDPAAAFIAPGIFIGIYANVIDQHTAFIAPVIPILINTAVCGGRDTEQAGQNQADGNKRKYSTHQKNLPIYNV